MLILSDLFQSEIWADQRTEMSQPYLNVWHISRKASAQTWMLNHLFNGLLNEDAEKAEHYLPVEN